MIYGKRPITLTSDFGLADGFVGTIKGVILSIAREALIVDLSHEVKPWDIASAAWIIGNCYQYFPPGAIHVVVVDPGVGTSRRLLALASSSGTFIGPDNGVFSLVVDQLTDLSAWTLTNEKFWLPSVSSTFHGRDILAPVAAALSNGVRPDELGPRIDTGSLVRLPKPPLVTTGDGISGAVVYVDIFGNLITNIKAESLAADDICLIDGRPIGSPVLTYGQAGQGRAAAIIGSHGYLEIGVNQGRACEVLSCGVGKVVEVRKASGAGTEAS